MGGLAKDKKVKDAELPEEGEDGEVAPKKKGLPIKLIAIIGGAVLLLGGGGAAAYFFLLAPKAKPHAEADAHAEKKPEKKKEEKKDSHGKGGAEVDPATQPVIADGPDGVVYFSLPVVMSNIESADGRSSYLKLKLTFEVADHETADKLTAEMPRLNDILQGFIRELRPEDLKGSEGNYQLRLEILRRVNLILAPSSIKAVLIEEMLIT